MHLSYRYTHVFTCKPQRHQQYIGDILVSSSRDKTIKMWDLITGECTNTTQVHENAVESLIFI